MRFLFITTKADWGGSEPLWCEAAEKALQENHEVVCVLPATKELHVRHKNLNALGAKMILRPQRLVPTIGNRLRWKLAGVKNPETQWWRDNFHKKPDAICVSQGGTYCALSMPGLLPWLKECDAPYLVVCHSHRNYALPDAVYRAELRKYLLGAAKVGFVAHEHIRASARFLGVELRNATVVQNPVNLAEEEIPENLTTEDTESTTRQLVGCSVDCQRQPEGQDERERASQRLIDTGPCLDKPSGAAFSNPSTSGLARDSENTSLNRSASIPASLPARAPQALMACVARLEIRDKGQDLLLEALADPVWNERDFRLDFYGSGPDREILEDLIALYGLGEKVRIAGFESDIRKIWAEHELLVLPSISEGTPISLIEAQICGRAALVTRVDGNPDWVEEGWTGFLAEAPTVHHLRLALERAWENRHRWREMGEAARKECLAKRDPDPAGTLLALLREVEGPIKLEKND